MSREAPASAAGSKPVEERSPGNLPEALSSFVGRGPDLTELAALVGVHRLVTVTGPPGVGKTRLATEAARRQAERFPDGTWVAELAAVARSSLVPGVLASALSIAEKPRRSITDILVEHLRPRRALVILDNCEHVLERVAPLAQELLQACPHLRVLATSREPLRVAGESVWELAPLSVPPAGDTVAADHLLVHDAVRLFIDRASARLPGFALSQATAPAVAEICRRLDGIPLAIELAAARVGVVSPEEIAERLDDRFRLLVTGGRTDLPRHRTLLGAIEWSHDLLDERERFLFRRLAVFAGGWTVAAAERVCAGPDLPPDEVLEVLSRLVDKSLVRSRPARAETRFRFLETIRDFAVERMAEADESDALREAHARRFGELAERAEPELTGPRQKEWLERLDADVDNLRAAAEWRLSRGDVEPALRITASLAPYWYVRGSFREGRAFLEAALGLPGEQPAAARAPALRGLGHMLVFLGQLAAAVPVLEESVALYRRVGPSGPPARLLSLLAELALLQSPRRAVELLEESVPLARQEHDAWALGDSLRLSGYARVHLGELPAARAAFEECVAVAKAAGDERGMWRGISGLGMVCLLTGDHETAARHLGESLRQARAFGDASWGTQTHTMLVELTRARGDLARARMLAEEGVTAARRLASPFPLAAALGVLGRVWRDEGRSDRARPIFEEAVALARASGVRVFLAWWLLGLGWSVEEAEPDRARELYQEARSFAQESGNRRDEGAALLALGWLALRGRDEAAAAQHLHAALERLVATHDAAGTLEALEALAGVAVLHGRAEQAARLLAATDAYRRSHPLPRPPRLEPGRRATEALTRDALAPHELERARTQGAALTLEEAVALAARGRGPRRRPTTGWEALTAAQRDVARLAAQGLTNTEIGERLFVSRRTVQAHLSEVFAKLGVSSRRQLGAHVPDRSR